MKPTQITIFNNLLDTLADTQPALKKPLLIVGGACRDALVGVEPKDYDVLVNIQDPCSKVAFEYMVEWAVNIRKLDLGSVEVYQAYGTSNDCKNHFNKMYSLCAKVVLLDGTKLDLLFVKGTCLDTVDSFDSNVNKVYYSEQTGLIERLGADPSKVFIVRNNLPAGRVVKAFKHWQEHYQEDV